MKNKNEVTGNLLLGCTVLRITREVPGATATLLLYGTSTTAIFDCITAVLVGPYVLQLAFLEEKCIARTV